MATEDEAVQEPEAVAPNGAVVDVGAIVGLLRRKRGMSLDELATRSDLSPSFISAVERGKSDIALGRLARIAAVFGLDVASLLTYSSNTSRPRFLSSDDRTPVDRGEGVDYRRLRLPGVDFELITVTFEPRTAFRDALAHDGIDIVYVPVGSVVLDFDGVDYVMNAGDSGVWSGRTPHAFRNDTDSPAQLVAVVTDTVWDL
ncbi:HTH-type transcriptional regulator PuuR [Capillimicrobium parvum]|uniref:HTH-type transcriptional regulator PuuR n=1 Tax=Capillimicrobium parvum TaxID=2884022 RepID=A0A9E6Y320_9ACTN|nr:HTH-type transcriptional regulator PuuR [Capillimicrobium parvum]